MPKINSMKHGPLLTCTTSVAILYAGLVFIWEWVSERRFATGDGGQGDK